MNAPGSAKWWLDTALIAAGGVALALLLWDGPIWDTTLATDATATIASPEAPRSLADLMAAGCISGEDLRALREGEQIRVLCPIVGPGVQDDPDTPRPFP